MRGGSGLDDVIRDVLMMIADECEAPFSALGDPLEMIFKDPKQEAFFRDKIVPKLELVKDVKEIVKKKTRTWEMDGEGTEASLLAMLIAFIVIKSRGEALKIDRDYHSKEQNAQAINEGGMSDDDIKRIADITDLLEKEDGEDGVAEKIP